MHEREWYGQEEGRYGQVLAGGRYGHEGSRHWHERDGMGRRGEGTGRRGGSMGRRRAGTSTRMAYSKSPASALTYAVGKGSRHRKRSTTMRNTSRGTMALTASRMSPTHGAEVRPPPTAVVLVSALAAWARMSSLVYSTWATRPAHCTMRTGKSEAATNAP